LLHYQGEIVPKDLAQAYTWSILAAKRGHLLAGTTMRKLRPQFTDEQVAEAARLAKEWKPVN
jgi:TPR repeat protein